MATIKIADLVAAIPYGQEGKKRYRTVGALLKHSNNDESKGPGFTVTLDAWFNPAGLPISNDGTVYLSCYHPKDLTAPAHTAPRTPPRFSGADEDDIPF